MYPRSHRGRTSTLLTHLQGHRRHPIIGGSNIRLCRNGWEHAPCKPWASPAGQVPLDLETQLCPGLWLCCPLVVTGLHLPLASLAWIWTVPGPREQTGYRERGGQGGRNW